MNDLSPEARDRIRNAADDIDELRESLKTTSDPAMAACVYKLSLWLMTLVVRVERVGGRLNIEDEDVDTSIIKIPINILQIVFDVAVGSMNFTSGFLDDEEVGALRLTAILLGLHPDCGTPDNFKKRFNNE